MANGASEPGDSELDGGSGQDSGDLEDDAPVDYEDASGTGGSHDGGGGGPGSDSDGGGANADGGGGGTAGEGGAGATSESYDGVDNCCASSR